MALGPELSSLEILAFGDLEGPWGVAWRAGDGPAQLALCGAGGEQVVPAAWDEGPDVWRLQGDGIELTVAAEGEELEVAATNEGAPGAAHRRCQVAGRIGGGAAQLPGRIGRYTLGAEGGRVEEVREVSAWFWPEESVSLLAVRPRRARGHDQDAVTSAVMVPEGFPPIADPRLSTTYSATGEPTRFSLELWSEDEERGPRRVAGEAIAPALTYTAGEWQLLVRRFRAHSRGQDGPALYLLARAA